MTRIEVRLTGTAVSAKLHGALTSGMVGVPVTFSFDSSWDGLSKIAVFQGCTEKARDLVGGNETTVPHEVLASFGVQLKIGVEGRKPDGTVVYPSVMTTVGVVQQGADGSADLGAEPTPSRYDDIMAAIAKIHEDGVKLAESEIQRIVAEYWDKHPPEPGYSPTVTTEAIDGGYRITIRDKDSAQSFDVLHGQRGTQGPEGKQGPVGPVGPIGPVGPAGPAPVKGVDYYTDADKAEMVLNTPQALTKEQKAQARENIGAIGGVETSVLDENSDYTHVTGKIVDTQGNIISTASWKIMYFTAKEDFELYVGSDFNFNYFRMAIYDGEMTSSKMLAFYQKNIDSATNTMPTNDNKADVKAGNIVVFSMLNGSSSFEVFKDISLAEHIKTLERSVSVDKMYYRKTSNTFDIYIQSKISENFMHYVYKHDVDKSTNLDTWRFFTYEIVDAEFNRLYGNTTGIEMDSVVKETGTVDFVGGYHGDENMTAFSVMVDGKTVDSQIDTPLTKFHREIRFVGTSTMDRCNTPGDAVFTRYKTNVFSMDGYYSKQRWVALQSVDVQNAYMGMMTLPVTSDGVTMVTTARMDNNFIEQTFHADAVPNGALYPSKDAREIEIYGDKIYGRARFISDVYDESYSAFCDHYQTNNYKGYFRVGINAPTFVVGDELRGEMKVEFLF